MRGRGRRGGRVQFHLFLPLVSVDTPDVDSEARGLSVPFGTLSTRVGSLALTVNDLVFKKGRVLRKLFSTALFETRVGFEPGVYPDVVPMIGEAGEGLVTPFMWTSEGFITSTSVGSNVNLEV